MDRPIAEQLWHAHVAETGEFAELESMANHEVETLGRVLRATPDQVGRRVVSDWNGNAIWFRRTKGGLRWYTLTWPQDLKLRDVG